MPLNSLVLVCCLATAQGTESDWPQVLRNALSQNREVKQVSRDPDGGVQELVFSLGDNGNVVRSSYRHPDPVLAATLGSIAGCE